MSKCCDLVTSINLSSKNSLDSLADLRNGVEGVCGVTFSKFSFSMGENEPVGVFMSIESSFLERIFMYMIDSL